jgi:hypothetical protein
MSGPVTLLSVGKRTQKFVEELKAWCDKEPGRRRIIAEIVGVHPQAVTNWFGGRQEPTLEQYLAIHEYWDSPDHGRR